MTTTKSDSTITAIRIIFAKLGIPEELVPDKKSVSNI